ncbi:branched-chain amino acid ABC transporter permease [Achromobacter seleniivolatilans]|uniref:Branched-chain amino acid ABC transporter permease n=1 Tax=Achromobacter seleniivolatilans TaxID=3047478 RepID=A0ABY9M0U2_9BURK|nr:branched-chain amino acid ABC transporter permease [Achromobacter sp. R39]WMD20609.1 branched-chain amino acid ABC transporter permease [Achromobacter sp. R39]
MLNRFLPFAALLALATFAWSGSDYYTGLAIKIMIYAIFALSLQLLVGGAGLVSLGHAAFFGIGAYAAALLSPESEAASLWWLLPAALLAAAVYAVVTGALALRTKGVYFIMVTLAFAQMAYYVFHDTKVGGGSDGIYLYFRPELAIAGWMPFDLSKATTFYYFVLACLAFTWGFLALLRRSPFGAALAGIRINEQRMRAAGYSTYPYKLTAYVVGATLASLAGFLFALKDGFVTPELLAWEQSGLVLLMVILGGMASLGGAVLGTVALVLMQELFQSQELFGDYARHWHLPLGIAIIALVALLPNGLAGLPAQWRQRREARLAGVRDAPPSANAKETRAATAARLPIQGEPHV